MSMGELLAGLPSEVRVHIFCLALDLPTVLRHWLDLAMSLYRRLVSYVTE